MLKGTKWAAIDSRREREKDLESSGFRVVGETSGAREEKVEGNKRVSV